MAYCPKCGVEVDDTVRSCPLCQFPIPDVHAFDEENVLRDDETLEILKKYPQAYNIYQDYRLKVKNQIFFAVLIVFISAIIIMYMIKFFYPVSEPILRYVLVITISLVFYIFFLFGYLRAFLNITGLFVTTLYLSYSLARLSGGQTWFFDYAVPLNILVYLNVLAAYYMYKKSKSKRRFGFFPTFVILMIAILCLGIDALISMNIHNSIRLSWSIIVAVGCGSVAIILRIITKNLSEHMKDTIRRRLHL
jgi:uncharacterized membrane protein YecN with MAPEG domain